MSPNSGRWATSEFMIGVHTYLYMCVRVGVGVDAYVCLRVYSMCIYITHTVFPKLQYNIEGYSRKL